MFEENIRKAVSGWKRVGERSLLIQFKSTKIRDEFLFSLLPDGLPKEKKSVSLDLPLNPIFTFEAFRTQQDSKMAQLMCLAASEKLQVLNTPVVLVGPHGCGKTHLLQAAVARRRQREEEDVAVYTTAEQFVNLYIAATMNQKRDTFLQSLQKIQLLALDDLQFFCNKPRSSESFVALCQTIIKKGSEILLATSEPLMSLKRSVPSLLPLLDSAIVCVVKTPSIEEKMSILKQKADLLNVKVSEEDMKHIVQSTDTVNEAEGLLLRYKFTKDIPKKKGVRTILKEIEQRISTMTERGRKTAQQILIFLLKKAGYDNLYILKALNLKSPSSIRYAIRKVEKLLDSSSLDWKLLKDLSKYVERSIK